MATNNAPLSVNAVTLRVKDCAKVSAFYQSVIGLDVINSSSQQVSLGVNNKPLLYLQEDRLAKRRPTESGLFHTAFLLPTRNDLGAWLRHAADIGVKLDGMANHLVSEAVYLQDPEGNGIEIYVDRDRSEWSVNESGLKMDSVRLDMRELLELPNQPWLQAPDDTVIGHVHLQVGNIQETDAFYVQDIGFDQMNKMTQASFYGSGGYHHHLAGNTWNSSNATQRSAEATGLVQIDLLSTDLSRVNQHFTDPWGINVAINLER